MNKTIKKIVALSMGATMLAGTAAMALATDLSDYPAPFVKDGVFVGKIVLGEKAASIDTLGALDIASSLQRASAVSVSGSGSSTSAVAADGYLLEENDILVLGGELSSVGTNKIDDVDLPELLASGTIEADDGTEYDYDVEVDISSGTASDVVVAAEIDSDLQDLGYVEPVVYLDLETAGSMFYSIKIDFEDVWDVTDFADSETIELFGKDYTFDPNNALTDDVITLFGSENTLLIGKGESKTVTYMGEDYTVEVLGGNSDDSSAIVRINGDSKTVTEGDSKTLGGLPIYIKDVFVSNIGGDEVSVNLFVGSDKIELDQDGTVTKNGVELDEVTASYSKGTDWADVDTITFSVEPVNAEDEVTQLLPGESYSDPVFGAFKFEFVGSKDLEAGKTPVMFTTNGDVLSVEFTPRGASKAVKIDLFENNATEGDVWDTRAALGGLVEDSIFFWNDGTAADNYETHALQIDSIDTGNESGNEDFEIVIKDLSHGGSHTLSSTSDDYLGLYPVSSQNAAQANFTDGLGGSIAQNQMVWYTTTGDSIDMDPSDSDNLIEGNVSASGTVLATITEDVDADADTASAIDFDVTVGWDSVDTEYDLNIDVSNFDDSTELGDNDDVEFYLSQYGTFVSYDNEDDSWVKAYLPAGEVGYDLFLLPVNSEVTVSTSSTGGAVALNPIAVGMAILDSEANLGSKPYIVVGGPCANTVAAALLGNKANCAEGFTEGKAVIKLFSDKNALLVAGYSGKDTQGACRVLANSADYSFDGNELEVVTTSLSSLSVKKVSS